MLLKYDTQVSLRLVIIKKKHREAVK